MPTILKGNTFLFTPNTLEDLPVPEKMYVSYTDKKCAYLRLYLRPSGKKSFYVYRKLNGKPKRFRIGDYPLISIEDARKEALSLASQIAFGKDPHAEKEIQRQDRLTFGEHFHDYMERYSKLQKRSWRYDQTEVNYHLSHWFSRRLTDISKNDIQRLHEKLAIESGLYAANSILKRLSAIFNKAIEWGWKGTNPTLGIKKYRTYSRDRFIQPHEMPFFLKALKDEPDILFRDYFMLLLLTGVRKTNGLQMRFQDVLWDRCAWRIPHTKNGEPLLIPIVDEGMEILNRRKSFAFSQWVFPQEGNPAKHISTPQKPWRNLLARATLYIWQEDETMVSWIEKKTKKYPSYLSCAIRVERLIATAQKEEKLLPGNLMDIRLHDLRRTFGSYQALTGASLPIIGSSLGHKSPQSTMIYARLNLDPIRAAVEKSTKTILNSCI